MGDVLFKVVTLQGDGVVEPFVSERAVTRELAKGVIDVLNEEGIQEARKIFKEVTPHQYIDSEIYGIVKSIMKEKTIEDEDAGLLSIPIVVLSKQGKAEGIDRIDVSVNDAEAVNELAWKNYGNTVSGVAKRAGLKHEESRQIVDEIVSFLF